MNKVQKVCLWVVGSAVAVIVVTCSYLVGYNTTEYVRSGKSKQEPSINVSFLELQKNHLKLLSSIPSKRIEIYEFTDPANGERMIVVFKGDQVAIVVAQPPL